MADAVREMCCYTTSVPSRPGAEFRVLDSLVSADINVLDCHGGEAVSRACIEVVPEDDQTFTRAVTKADLSFERSQTRLLIQREDRPGRQAANLKRLADASTNVEAIEGLAAGAGHCRELPSLNWCRLSDSNG